MSINREMDKEDQCMYVYICVCVCVCVCVCIKWNITQPLKGMKLGSL